MLPKVCVFDAYGTLFSVTMPVEELDARTDGRGEALLNIWRQKQLEYTWLRGLMQAYVPFDRVTEEALTFAMRRLGISDAGLYELMMPVFLEPDIFDDVLPALEYLRQRDIRTAILSNGTLRMLEEGTQRTGLAPYLDHLLSADHVGEYKPASAVYFMVLEAFQVEPKDVCFFSSNQWDIAGAGHFGLPTAWVNRRGLSPEVLPPPPTYTLSSLADIQEKIIEAEQ